jgi:hypothetical protein
VKAGHPRYLKSTLRRLKSRFKALSPRPSKLVTDTPDGSPESREQQGIAMGLVCFPLSSSTMPAHGMCAMRCCYIHLCCDAAGIIHQPADFPYGTPFVRG